jgi:hypothetical protein
MKVHHFSAFNLKGGASLPAGYKAVGIHPSSEVDLVQVDNDKLTVMGLVPTNPANTVKLTALRSYRDTGLDVAEKDQVGGYLAVVCYEECDDLENPGPRRPFTFGVRLDLAAFGATTINAATLVQRVPFMGRQQLALYLKRSTTGADLNVVVRGVRYFDRDQLVKIINAGDGPTVPYVDELQDSWWGGAAAAPVSAIDGTTVLGRTIYIGGGGDLQECYDEFEIWAYGAAGGFAYIAGEALGDRADT